MTHLSAAQQTQMDNRDRSGQWKQKTHGDVEDTAGVLGVALDSHSSPRYDARTLREFSAERIAWHNDHSALCRESMYKMGDDLDDINPSDEDEFLDDADRANHHEVASVAHKLPANATYAEVEFERVSDLNPRVCAWFDRDGDRHVINIPFDQIESADTEIPFTSNPEGAAPDRYCIDLEAAHDWSNEWAETEASELRDSGQEEEHLPNVETGEIRGLRRRARLRRFEPDADHASGGDHIEVWLGEAAVNSGTATNEVPGTYPGEFRDGDLAFVQDDGHTHILSAGTLARDDVIVYTDRQRALEQDSGRSANLAGHS